MPQQQALFIGVVDLSVRLSSMNPIKMLDVDYQEAHLESLIIRRIKALIDKFGASAIDRTIIRPGMTPKQFEFANYAQFEAFTSNLQWDLLSQADDGTSVPFKMCVGTSNTAAHTLLEAWGKDLDDLALGNIVEPAASSLRRKLRDKFSTDKLETVRQIIGLYQAEGVDSDRLQLGVELESFKGMGFYATNAFLDAVPAAKRLNYFTNFFPVKRAHSKYSIEEFVSLKLDIVADDIIKPKTIERYGELKTIDVSHDDGSLDTGSRPVLSGLIRLLRRSIGADEANGIYYISMFNCFIMSSNFKQLNFHQNRVQISKSQSEGLFWDAGWHGYPPIFEAVLLDPQTRAIFKRLPAKEMLLASLLGAVYRDMQLAHKIFVCTRLRVKVDQALQTAIDTVIANGEQSPVREANGLKDIPLTHLITQLAATYGKPTVRAILNLKIPGVTDILQKFILNTVSTDM